MTILCRFFTGDHRRPGVARRFTDTRRWRHLPQKVFFRFYRVHLKIIMLTPLDKRKIVATSFPPPALNNVSLHCVSEFEYLCHIISNNMSDGKDIMREIRNLFLSR